MNIKTAVVIAGLLTSFAAADPSELTKPIVGPNLIFEETGGFIAVEAEHFFKQEKADVRAWYRTTPEKAPGIKPDADPSHVAGTSPPVQAGKLPPPFRPSISWSGVDWTGPPWPPLAPWIDHV